MRGTHLWKLVEFFHKGILESSTSNCLRCQWSIASIRARIIHNSDKHAGYLNYYDACVEGLKSVHPSLQMGTPGESCKGFGGFCMVRVPT